jgi:hypothetical protein
MNSKPQFSGRKWPFSGTAVSHPSQTEI